MEYTFITGATGGIGKAFCRYYAKEGCNIFITGRSEEKLAALKEELLDLNDSISVKYLPADLTDRQSRDNLFAYADSNEISVTRLVNVAGADIQKGFLSYTDDKVIFQIRVNVEATISLTHMFLERLDFGDTGNTKANRKKAYDKTGGKKKNLPEIITVSSLSGVSPMPYFQLYSATKACLTNFFKSLRVELKGKVNVTTVLPGGVYTRPDICADIKGQGLWGKLSAKTPDFVVNKSVKGVRKNKKLVIPGFWNKSLYTLMKFVPENVKLKFIANRWKKQTKDAF